MWSFQWSKSADIFIQFISETFCYKSQFFRSAGNVLQQIKKVAKDTQIKLMAKLSLHSARFKRFQHVYSVKSKICVMWT